jgi:RHS repeat-associated protein
LLVALQSTHSVAATTTLEPIADAYVLDGSWANSNFGTSTWLFTKTDNTAQLENYDSYLKFDLSTVASVASATLRLNSASGDQTIGGTLYAVSDTTWSETGITWNNKPARGAALGSITVSGSKFIYREIDVSSYVRSEKAAGRNLVSFALHNPLVSTDFIWIRSRQATTNHPQLVITPNEAPAVALTSPANGATFTAPASITLTATAADTDGTIAKVEFFHGGTNLIATVTSAPYTFNWTNVGAGSYTLTAKATDNLGGETTSAPVNITVNAGVAQLHFIHTDHLNTPRLITNNTGQAVWRWDQADPFGGNVPNENPSGLGAFTCNLRLPGQYFDKESNTHYNYHRDYDPAIGRYIQSDPIGLLGGINTYAYVAGNPLQLIDSLGLDVFLAANVAANPTGYLTSPTSLHLSLQLIPNDPGVFANAPGFGNMPSGEFGSTLSGQPFGDPTTASSVGNLFPDPVTNNFPFGLLRGVQNYPANMPSQTPFRLRVSPPCGMTDTQFINALLGAFGSYNNNLPYSTFPSAAAGTYNSNSLVAGILAATGKKPPALSLAPFFQVPGYNRPVPLPSFSACGCLKD